jgi:hypothetical protein
VTALIGAVVGFLLAILKTWLDRRSRVSAHKKALAAEVLFCVSRAQTYRHPTTQEDNVKSPAYRCPTDAIVAAFPWLLQDGALPAEHVTTVEEFYAEVADFNRCLDYCHDARYYRHPGEPDDARLNQEYARAQKKAENVIEKKDATIQVLQN